MAGAPAAQTSHESHVRFDAAKLADAVEAVISHRRITGADAAREIGIPRPTLSEVRGGQISGGTTALKVLAWLHRDPAQFILPDEPAPKAVVLLAG